MNKHLIFASLLLMSPQQITFAMETNNTWDTVELKPVYRTGEQVTQTNQSTTQSNLLDELISITVDAAINEKYPTKFRIFSPQLTEQNFFDIINIIMQHTAIPNRNLINKLSAKNNLCKQAIKHFIDLAHKNKNNVTIDTLETIQDPTLPQPTAELNKLPMIIRTIIMNDVYNSIDPFYDIILTGHTATINFFDICTSTHQAATSSLDKTLRLWDLKTGKLVHTFPEDKADTIFCIAFNPDGSLLATVDRPDGSYTKSSYYCSAKVNNIIKIWSTESAQLLHTMQHSTEIRSLYYTQNNLLLLCNEINDYDYNIAIISANKNSMETLANTTKKYVGQDHVIWDNMYQTDRPSYGCGKRTLTVTKLHCRPLYLCDRSIENTRDVSSNIETVPLFKEFTEYEQDMLRTKQSKKIESLSQAAELAVKQRQTQSKRYGY